MDKSRLSEEIALRAGISRTAQALIFLLAASTLLLSLYVFLHQDRDRVVFLPPTIDRGFWIERAEVSKDYLEQMGLFVIQLAYNVTPASVEYQNAALLRYAAPEAYGALEKAGRLAAERIKRDQISTVFAPQSVIHAKDGALACAFTGQLTTYVTDKASPPRQVTILVRFRHEAGKTLVVELRETDANDPFGDKSAAV